MCSSQAVEALLYLHTPVAGGKGCVIHRDFKPENILFDENLHAYLADTGFAKSERPDTTARSTRLVLTYGYLDPDITQGGKASTATDGYAVGITLLVVLTGRSPLQIIKKCEEEMDCDFEELDATRLAETDADWPAHVARAIAPLVLGGEESLCHHKPRKRVSLATVLRALQELVDAPKRLQTDQEIPSLQQSNENAVIAADTSASLSMPSPEPLAMGASCTPALPWQPLRMPPVQKEKTPTVPPEMLVPPAPPETSSRTSAEAALHFDVKRFVELNDAELDHQASPRQQVLDMIAS